VKRFLPNVVFFSFMFLMISAVGYFGPESTEYVTYQWDYAFSSGLLWTAITYGMCKLCGNWANKIDERK